MQRSINDFTLQNVPKLSHLDNAILEALQNNAILYRLQPNEVLYYQGDIADSFYLVLEGGVRLLEFTPDGQQVGIKVYGQGDLFGLLAITGAFPHPSQVEAMDDSIVMGLNGEVSRDLMLQFPQLALTVVDLLVDHVHHAHDRIRQMAAERVDRRLARTLILFCEKFGTRKDDETCIDISLSQQELAYFTGSTVETINRILREWEKAGIVRRGRLRLDVLDKQRLLTFASAPAHH